MSAQAPFVPPISCRQHPASNRFLGRLPVAATRTPAVEPGPEDQPRDIEVVLAVPRQAQDFQGGALVVHELRDTWIEAARHNEVVKKEIYEIITGHSAKTGSDGYGGERPSVLMTANETICKDLLDADLRAAIMRLVE